MLLCFSHAQVTNNVMLQIALVWNQSWEVIELKLNEEFACKQMKSILQV